MRPAPATLAWFAGHEVRLAFRETVAMLTGGRPRRGIRLLVGLALLAILLHLLAAGLVAPWLAAGIAPDKPTLVLLTGGGLLFWSVMLSQAMESVTRAYYARADLDLILSSPASAARLFAVRTGAVALSTAALTALTAAPVIDMLALLGGARWLLAYLVLVALAAFSVSLALVATVLLFRLVGPRRTRLVAQIVAAIVGAGFVIGVQAAAILAYGNISRYEIFRSAAVLSRAPGLDSPLWLPARAALGDPLALALVLVVGLGALALAIGGTASDFGRRAIAAASVPLPAQTPKGRRRPFRQAGPMAALRRKEWLLLRRDPWLVSQTLMQILYLVPPALLLWVNYGRSAGAAMVIVPVLVMAAGQLAGGLAWLAISGEDAHDLVASAPLPPAAILLAKVESVLAVVAIVLLPLVAGLALALSWRPALVAAGFALLAAGSATAIQLWFRRRMRRALFRRRQVASRFATLSEAFSSILWAGAAALGAAGSLLAAIPAGLALAVLAIAHALGARGREGAHA